MTRPDLALLDLQLARGSTGFAAAAELARFGIMCLFVSGKAPSFSMGDLAIGCLTKPFTADDLHLSLSIAEDKLRERSTARLRVPANLTLYEEALSNEELDDCPALEPSRRSLKTRLLYWIIGLGSD